MNLHLNILIYEMRARWNNIQASCNKFEVLRNQNHNLLENFQKKWDVKLNNTDTWDLRWEEVREGW